jgi:hypothetical protein
MLFLMKRFSLYAHVRDGGSVGPGMTRTGAATMETMEQIVFDEVACGTAAEAHMKVRALLAQQLRRLHESRSCLDRITVGERIRGIAECAHALGVLPLSEFTAIIMEVKQL